jgi:hypothetical protein
MPHVLLVTAVEHRDPVAGVVEVEIYDASFQEQRLAVERSV